MRVSHVVLDFQPWVWLVKIIFGIYSVNECKCQILSLIYPYTSPALPSIYIYIYRTRTQAHGNSFCSSVGRAYGWPASSGLKLRSRQMGVGAGLRRQQQCYAATMLGSNNAATISPTMSSNNLSDKTSPLSKGILALFRASLYYRFRKIVHIARRLWKRSISSERYWGRLL